MSLQEISQLLIKYIPKLMFNLFMASIYALMSFFALNLIFYAIL